MSVGLGGRNISLSLSKIDMTFPRLFFRAKEKQKGRWRTISLACLGRHLVAAYVFSRLFCRDLRRRILRGGNHGYESATLEAGLERHLTVAQGKKRMVLANAHILARPEFGAALAHDHVAAGNLLAAKQLHAQALAGRVTAVT